MVSVLRTVTFNPNSLPISLVRFLMTILGNTSVKYSKLVKSTVPIQFRKSAKEIISEKLKHEIQHIPEYQNDDNEYDSELNIDWVVPFDISLNQYSNVLIYIHGGGYIIGSFDIYKETVDKICHKTGCVGLGVRYRLSPEHPFPCQLEDILATLLYLTSPQRDGGLGMRRDQIVVSGDSAGGGLSSSLLHFLADHSLGQIAGGLLFSPYLDLTRKQSSNRIFEKIDILGLSPVKTDKLPFKLDEGDFFDRIAYLGSRSEIRNRIERDGNHLLPVHLIRHPNVSPLFHPKPVDLPPILIQTGESEKLRDESYLYADLIHKTQNISSDGIPKVTLQYFQDQIHDFMALPSFSGKAGWLEPASNFVKGCFIKSKKELKKWSESSPILVNVPIEEIEKPKGKLNCYWYNVNGIGKYFEPEWNFEEVDSWEVKN